MDWDDLALVGRIARPHGLKGHVVVNLETDFPEERFSPGAEVLLRRRGRIEAVTIATIRFQKGRPVVSFDGLDSIEAVEALAGEELRVPLERLKPLPEGSFYRHDLIGCRVELEDGTSVGVVSDVEVGMGGHRLVIDAPGKSPLLVPMASEICSVIDLTARRIVIRPPVGLLELNERP